MSRIVLGVTGSVAAIRTPLLYELLRAQGHAVRVVCTEPALHFFKPDELTVDPAEPLGQAVFRDRDEWPEANWQRDEPVPHIEFRRWADLLVIAPLDANTLAKCALGLADNFLTCLFRAWDFQKPVILAPAMNTLMWDSPVTRRHFRLLLEDRGLSQPEAHWDLDDVQNVFAQHAPGIIIVPPVTKRLACGDVGQGAMASVDQIIQSVKCANE